MDMVDVITYMKKQLKGIERNWSTIHPFLNSMREEDKKYLFQGDKLKGFDNAKTTVSSKKNVWLE